MPNEIGEVAALVDALCTIHMGWTTDAEKNGYDAAWKQITSRAQEIEREKSAANNYTSSITLSEIYAALGLIAAKIEQCGASRELTDAVCAVSDLRAAVGNEYNPPKQYSLNSVRKLILESKH